MSDINELVKSYLAAWNETDPAARQARIAEVMAEDVEYTDPLIAVKGRNGLDAAMAAVQGQFAGLEFSLAGTVDAHHNLARFTWELAPDGAEAIVVGFDVAVLTEDGRLSNVHGFLDRVPG